MIDEEWEWEDEDDEEWVEDEDEQQIPEYELRQWRRILWERRRDRKVKAREQDRLKSNSNQNFVCIFLIPN